MYARSIRLRLNVHANAVIISDDVAVVVWITARSRP